MFNLRDYKLKQQKQQAGKADAKPRYRAVITASDGSRTEGSPWADEDAKQVWHQRFGSGGLGRAWCKAIVPEVGLGVIVSPTDDKLGWEVVESDPFLRRTATDPRNYETIAPEDLQPGGRLMLWVDSRQITPLSTYDTPGTLLINVASGDYAYLGVRKTFAGAVGQDLSGYVPGGGLTRYVGLYIDSSNALAFVAGGTVAIGATPPEPAWPDGAFQLSVVQLDNGQTAIVFADDIFDRRMAWTDVVSSSASAWPRPGKVNIGTTEYDTLADAVAAAVSGDLIKVGEGTFTGVVTIPDGVDLRGSGMGVTIISASSASATLTFAGESYTEDFSATNDTGFAIETGTGAAWAFNVEEINGGVSIPTGGLGELISRNCRFTGVGVLPSDGALSDYGSEIFDITISGGGTAVLYGTRVTGTISGGKPDPGSFWFDANGNLQPSASTEIWFFAR